MTKACSCSGHQEEQGRGHFIPEAVEEAVYLGHCLLTGERLMLSGSHAGLLSDLFYDLEAVWPWPPG